VSGLPWPASSTCAQPFMWKVDRPDWVNFASITLASLVLALTRDTAHHLLQQRVSYASLRLLLLCLQPMPPSPPLFDSVHHLSAPIDKLLHTTSHPRWTRRIDWTADDGTPASAFSKYTGRDKE
jgi:hypothetical protein